MCEPTPGLTPPARDLGIGTASLAAAIVSRLTTAIGWHGGAVPLHEPEFRGREWSYLRECLDTRQVSTIGPMVTRFETALALATGARHVVATVNGTAALHIALMIAGVCPGDEVLVPALSFVAIANATRYCGAIPHFVDSDPETLHLDARRLAAYLDSIADHDGGATINRRTGRRIAAIVPLHTFGHPVDLDPLLALGERLGLAIVEDAAQALGSRYRGRHAGTTGRAGILSFNGNKIVTTGGGGAILTNDPALAAEAAHLTTAGRVPHRWAISHDRVAYNYRLPNLNAALGCAQLEQLDAFLTRKRQLAARYEEAFADLEDVRVFREPGEARSNYWLNLLVLRVDSAALRDTILETAHRAGFMLRPAWTPMHELPMFAGCPRMDLCGAEQLARRLLALPSSPGLWRDQ